MKLASPGLVALLGSTRNLIFADLWTFTLKSGTVLRYTSWDYNLTIDGDTWLSHDVILEGGEVKQARGLEVGQTELKCYPNLTDRPSVIETVPFLQACITGLLDRAMAERSRIFMPTPGDTSLGAVRIFLGEINSVEVTRNYATLTCKDQTDLLNIYMPRRQYQPRCPWTFGDSNCKFDKSSTMKNSTALSGTTPTNIITGLTDASGHFNFGSVIFTTGRNKGVSRQVKSFAPGSIVLTGPFPQPIAIGDAFNIFQGCSKNFSGQTQQFNGAVPAGPVSTVTAIYSSLTNTAGFFNGGTIQFTSGGNVGQVRTVNSWIPPSPSSPYSVANLSAGLPTSPVAGDEFVLTSISSNTQNTCTGYSNTINFGGQPFVPIPETAY